MPDMKLPELPGEIQRADLVAALELLGIPADNALSLHMQGDEAVAVVHLVDDEGFRRVDPERDGLYRAAVTIPISPK